MDQNQCNLNEMLDSIKMEHFDNVDEFKMFPNFNFAGI